MTRWFLSLVMLLGVGISPTRAQPDKSKPSPSPSASEDKGTYLGVLFSPVPDIPEALYAHLPDLPRDHGVMVSFVLPDSPASKAGLRRHDILLTYDDTKIRDCGHFANLIREDKPERTVKLGLLREGKKSSVDVQLVLGPALKIAQSKTTPPENPEMPRAIAKSAIPESVSVTAKPLDGVNLKVTIEYYQERTGRLQTLSCTGSPTEIKTEIQKLPVKTQNLARAAFDRICEHHLQQKDSAVKDENN